MYRGGDITSCIRLAVRTLGSAATSWQWSSRHFPLMKSGNISSAHISHSAEHVLSSDAVKMTKIPWTLHTPWWLGNIL